MAIKNLNEQSDEVTNKNNKTNNSGQGKDSVVLDIVAKKFNWGAFLFTWVWGLFNKSYITLIVLPLSFLNFIPFLGTIVYAGVCIWFGIEGNKWAWQNKEWDSIEQFHKVQKKWAISAGIAMALICTALVVFLIIPFMLLSDTNKFSADMDKLIIKKELGEIGDTIALMKTDNYKCNLTSEGLLNCFSEYIIVKNKSDNTIKVEDGTSWTFKGDGRCKKKGDCTITIKTEKEKIEPAVVPIYALPDGYLQIKPSDIQEYLSIK